MKLRLRGNAIRLRLLRAEVRHLAERGIVEESTSFGPESRLRYVLDAREEYPAIAATLVDSTIKVLIPRSVAAAWASTEQVSLVAQQGDLSILVEKDFACLKPRTSPQWEDESDAFPNPNPSCGLPA